MKKHRMILVILMLIAGLLMSCGAPPGMTADDGFARRTAHMRLMTDMRLATIELTGFVGEGAGIRSTGILLRQSADSSVLLIAGHTARNLVGHSALVNGMVGDACAITKVETSSKYDLALAHVNCRLRGVPAKLAARPAVLGETIYIFGHTLGKPYTLTKGIVSSERRAFNIGSRSRIFTQVSAQALIGNSGGPAFNSKGELVGVLVGGPYAPVWTPFGPDRMRMVMVPHMALCVPFQHVRNFLAEKGML